MDWIVKWIVSLHCFSGQFLPFVGRKCASALHKIREIGRHFIEQRMRALDNKEELPQDIMSQILSIVRELLTSAL